MAGRHNRFGRCIAEARRGSDHNEVWLPHMPTSGANRTDPIRDATPSREIDILIVDFTRN